MPQPGIVIYNFRCEIYFQPPTVEGRKSSHSLSTTGRYATTWYRNMYFILLDDIPCYPPIGIWNIRHVPCIGILKNAYDRLTHSTPDRRHPQMSIQPPSTRLQHERVSRALSLLVRLFIRALLLLLGLFCSTCSQGHRTLCCQ